MLSQWEWVLLPGGRGLGSVAACDSLPLQPAEASCSASTLWIMVPVPGSRSPDPCRASWMSLGSVAQQQPGATRATAILIAPKPGDHTRAAPIGPGSQDRPAWRNQPSFPGAPRPVAGCALESSRGPGEHLAWPQECPTPVAHMSSPLKALLLALPAQGQRVIPRRPSATQL